MLGESSISRFRSERGAIVRNIIGAIASHFGRDITVLDVGGRPDYWQNVGLASIKSVQIINVDEKELRRPLPEGAPANKFERRVGDARNLSDYADASVDFVHSNSVIEHVGGWRDMIAMSEEVRRVGRAGWIQTPAWSFPVEPHFRTVFMHWFGRPLQARMMAMSFEPRIRKSDLHTRRLNVERINLLSRREFSMLFPESAIYTERFAFLAKSYTAHWLPDGLLVRI